MRLSIIGQAAFGQAVLDRLRADGHEIVAVSAPSGGSRPDPLAAAAEGAGVPVVATRALKDEAELERWRSFGAELGVMAFVTDILPDAVFDIPAVGTIQYHPSILPLHRGSSAMNWPIINGESETGLTIFWPDQGIDTGPVLLQKHVDIGAEETMGSLYFGRLFPMGVDALSEAVRMVEAGTAPRIEQDHALATYEPPCRDEHAQIPWHAPAERVHALIRGCSPAPGAWTTVKGSRLRIFECELTGTQAAGMPGRVLSIGDDGIDVRLNGGVLRLRRVQPEGGAKMPASQWAGERGITSSFRFR